MIYSKDCYLQSSCKKFQKDHSCADTDGFCPKLFKIEYLYNEALLPMKCRTEIALVADEVDIPAFQTLAQFKLNIEQFVEEGHNLFIYSSMAGNGKTSWAIKLLQQYFFKIWHKCPFQCKGLIINIPRFLLALKDNISQKQDYVEHIKKNVLTADLIIWDDIGTKMLTEFEAENLLSMIDTRMECGKANIYTSNLTPVDLESQVGARLASRVANASTQIQFFGDDKRGLVL